MDAGETYLMHFSVPIKKKGVSRGVAVALYKRLYGYESPSPRAKYHYHVAGLLEKIPAVRYPGGNILIRKRHWSKVRKVLRDHQAEYQLWKVIPSRAESHQLSNTVHVTTR